MSPSERCARRVAVPDRNLGRGALWACGAGLDRGDLASGYGVRGGAGQSRHWCDYHVRTILRDGYSRRAFGNDSPK